MYGCEADTEETRNSGDVVLEKIAEDFKEDSKKDKHRSNRIRGANNVVSQ